MQHVTLNITYIHYSLTYILMSNVGCLSLLLNCSLRNTDTCSVSQNIKHKKKRELVAASSSSPRCVDSSFCSPLKKTLMKKQSIPKKINLNGSKTKFMAVKMPICCLAQCMSLWSTIQRVINEKHSNALSV